MNFKLRIFKKIPAFMLILSILSLISACNSNGASQIEETAKQDEEIITPDIPDKTDVSLDETPEIVEPVLETLGAQQKIELSTIDLSTDGIDFADPNFTLDGLFDRIILDETEDATDEYLSKIVFVGESTTFGLKHYGSLPEGTETKHVWTPKSGTLMLTNANSDIGAVNVYNPNTGANEDMLIKDAVSLYKPEYLVITLGLNGVSYVDSNPEYYINAYITLINSIIDASPDTKIMVQSVFPVANSYKHIESISNERLNKANYYFAKMCDAMNVRFLNSAPIFKTEDGSMHEDYHNGDGLHLAPNTLASELDYIKTHKYN